MWNCRRGDFILAKKLTTALTLNCAGSHNPRPATIPFSKRANCLRKRIILGWVLSLATAGIAQERAHDAHGHGAGEKLGVVHFDTSCSQEAQREFDRAVALLHSFEFGRAVA